MGKSTKQSIRYERRLSNEQVRANRDLDDARLASQKELLQQAVAYERRYTDGQFSQLNLVAQEHRIFHEREHLLYEDAIEKASSSLTAALSAIQVDVDRFRDEATKWLTVERFEREHENLSEKTVTALKTLDSKIGAEERITIRQTTKDEVVETIQTNAQTTRRWIIGLAVTITIFGITTLIGIGTTMLHVFKVI